MTDDSPNAPRLVAAGDTDDAAAVVDVLTVAFTGDPLMRWLFPGSAAHVRSLRAWWELVVSLGGSGSELWLGSGRSTAAMWRAPVLDAPPDGDAPAADEDAQSRFGEVVTGLVGRDRSGEVFEMFARISDAHPVEPHWYLGAVGTRPEAQGRGMGAATLAPVLARCDAEGLPAYLESSNPRNLAFYHRLGFAETGTLTTPDGTATMTLMWRKPQG